MGATSKLYDKVLFEDLQINANDCSVDNKVFSANSSDSLINIEYSKSEIGMYYLVINKKVNPNFSISIGGTNEYLSDNDLSKIVFSSGIVGAGETFKCEMLFDDFIDFDDIEIMFMPLRNFVSNMEIIKENGIEIDYEKDGFSFDISSVGDCKVVVFSPNIKGYSFFDNNNSVIANKDIGAFLSFDISSGEHTIWAKYFSPYILPSIICGFVGFLLAFALYFVCQKKYNLLCFAENIIYPICKIGCIVLVVCFWLVGIVMFFVKFLL